MISKSTEVSFSQEYTIRIPIRYDMYDFYPNKFLTKYMIFFFPWDSVSLTI